LVPVIAELLAEKKLAYIDIDSRRQAIAAEALERLAPDFVKLGFVITDFRIEGTDFDEGTKQRIGQISDKLADRHAADQLGITYGELQQLMALRDAARNEGGAAGVLVGAGAGSSLGRMLASGNEMENQGGMAPEGALSRLRKLKGLFDEKLISEAEFNAKKQDILKDI
jgi:membrane protease subunit (stomatin/prohibitin family)